MEMTLGSITTFIKEIGFPIFVAVWLLWRIDPLLRDLTVAVKSLEIHLSERRSDGRS